MNLPPDMLMYLLNTLTVSVIMMFCPFVSGCSPFMCDLCAFQNSLMQKSLVRYYEILYYTSLYVSYILYHK